MDISNHTYRQDTHTHAQRANKFMIKYMDYIAGRCYLVFGISIHLYLPYLSASAY